MHVYFIDELAEIALVLLPFLLPQKRNKSNQDEFVRFISVRVQCYVITFKKLSHIICFIVYVALFLNIFFESNDGAFIFTRPINPSLHV